ncbi:hypothetical protein RvY_04855-1 [Ramazzottius varieornatus]|uniref:Probable RNA-binding protein EIF1AD n=1 Tax=Ramazzottius varieornatus TaxID=947166 RepID=A0A1D1UYP1_RAMVA|nr:hypothetical protein RvY_04855-1 [Ramazzottius varieornatus]
MSEATKRKLVSQEFLDGYVLPDEERKQEIVRIVGPRGNNLHEVETSSGEIYLVSMPPKFRKTVWIKRGDFVLVEPISEGDRVKGEIVNIIRTKQQIAYIASEGKWPEGFSTGPKESPAPTEGRIEPETTPLKLGILESDDDEGSEEDYSDLSPNLNRGGPSHLDSSEDSEDSDNDSESSDEANTEESFAGSRVLFPLQR